MSAKIVFLAKGDAFMGQTKLDADGKIISQTKAHFDYDEEGGCVAVGVIDPDTMQVQETPQVFGDFDPAGYLGEALKLLRPRREGNIPDLEAIVKKWTQDHGDPDCPFLMECDRPYCADCIIYGWMEEAKEERH